MGAGVRPDVRPSAGDTLGAGVGGLWAQWTQLLPVHGVARPLDAIPLEAVRATRLPFPRGWEVTPGAPTFPQGLRLPAEGTASGSWSLSLLSVRKTFPEPSSRGQTGGQWGGIALRNRPASSEAQKKTF